MDDSRVAAFVFGKLLEKLGHEVRTADGAAAAPEIAGCGWPDLVISDIRMPTIDGYELARRLRKEPGLKELQLVALTGYGQEKDKQLSQKAGFNHHLVKPVSLEALTDLLSALRATPLGPRVAAGHDSRAYGGNSPSVPLRPSYRDQNRSHWPRTWRSEARRSNTCPFRRVIPRRTGSR